MILLNHLLLLFHVVAAAAVASLYLCYYRFKMRILQNPSGPLLWFLTVPRNVEA